MGVVRTVYPIVYKHTLMIPGVTKGNILADLVSGKSNGTRRAVKIAVQAGAGAIHEGWVARHWFDRIQLYEAKRKEGFHRAGGL